MDAEGIDCPHETLDCLPFGVRESLIFRLDLFTGSYGQGGPGVGHCAIEMLSAGEAAAEDGIHGGATSFRNVKED
jgi:hypothetical protein